VSLFIELLRIKINLMTTSPSTGSPMDTEETGLSPLEESGLLDIDDDIIADSKKRIIDKPWAQWKEADKKIMMDYIKYHGDCIEFMNKCWASGPTTKAPPKKLESEALNLVKKGRKRKGTASSNSKKPYKIKSKAWNQMTDDDFIHYLLELLPKNIETTEISPATTVCNDSKSIAENLEKEYQKVKQGDQDSLRKHLNFGNYLITTKDNFDLTNIKKRIRRIRIRKE